MCHFITLVAPTDDVAALQAVMKRHGRGATPVDNASIRKVLGDADRQFLTTRNHCDCGTVLACGPEDPDAAEEGFAKEAERLKRKGWSTAKIARAMEGRRKAEARPDDRAPDSIDLWAAVLRDLGETLKLPHAGLVVRLYSGAIEAETFDARRREAPAGAPLNETLASMRQDEVTVFRLK